MLCLMVRLVFHGYAGYMPCTQYESDCKFRTYPRESLHASGHH